MPPDNEKARPSSDQGGPRVSTGIKTNNTASLRLAEQIMGAPGIERVQQDRNHEPTFWLRTRLAQIDRDAINGRLATCGHLTAGEPGIVALWAPGGVWCLPCAAVHTHLDGQENYECDRCGVHADPITVATIAARNAVVLFGLCDPCTLRERGRTP